MQGGGAVNLLRKTKKLIVVVKGRGNADLAVTK
jgi:hypothetical protein